MEGDIVTCSADWDTDIFGEPLFSLPQVCPRNAYGVPVVLGPEQDIRSCTVTIAIPLFSLQEKRFPKMHTHLGGFIKSIFSAAEGYRVACWVPARESETTHFSLAVVPRENLGFHCWHPGKKEGVRGWGVEQPKSLSL